LDLLHVLVHRALGLDVFVEDVDISTRTSLNPQAHKGRGVSKVDRQGHAD
jgi:hypothetical protein